MIATVGGSNKRWIHRRLLCGCPLADWWLRTRGGPASHTTDSTRRVCVGVRRGNAFVWNLGLPNGRRVDRPGRHASVMPRKACCFTNTSATVTKPPQLGWALMALGVGRRWSARWLCRTLETDCGDARPCDRHAHLWCCDGRHRVPAAVAADTGAVRGDGLVYGPIHRSQKLRDADPGLRTSYAVEWSGDDGVTSRRARWLDGGRSLADTPG